MKMNFLKLFATAAVIAGTIGGTSIAFAEKSGGISGRLAKKGSYESQTQSAFDVD